MVGAGDDLLEGPNRKRIGVAATEAESGGPQEARLIEACQQGDTSAFNLLFWRWERPLFHFVYRYVDDAALAEDLVQETFLRVVKSIARYSHRGSFSTWLYQVAVNQCKDHLRRKRLKVVSLHDSYTTASGEQVFVKDRVADERARTDAAAESADREELVRRLLGGLSEDQRVVIVLKEYQELTFVEIAEVLGIPESTVKARLYRGLRAMREQLEREGRSLEDGSGGAS